MIAVEPKSATNPVDGVITVRYKTCMRMAILLMAIAASAPRTAADDLADVKVANEVVVRAHNELDADLYFTVLHPEYVGFGKSSLAATDLARMTTNEAHTRLERAFASYESFQMTPIESNFRIVDGTAVVWGMQRVASKKVGEPPVVGMVRLLRIFVKTEGKWLMLAGHTSLKPVLAP